MRPTHFVRVRDGYPNIITVLECRPFKRYWTHEGTIIRKMNGSYVHYETGEAMDSAHSDFRSALRRWREIFRKLRCGDDYQPPR